MATGIPIAGEAGPPSIARGTRRWQATLAATRLQPDGAIGLTLTGTGELDTVLDVEFFRFVDVVLPYDMPVV